MRSLPLALAAALIALVALPAAGSASTVSVVGNELRYAAGAGEVNAVTISLGTELQNVARIQDSVPITPGDGCQQGTGPAQTQAASPNEAFCFITEDFAGTVLAELRDRDDSLHYIVNGASTGGVQARIIDGSGNDRVTDDSPNPDTIVNGPGDDVFRCGDAECGVLTGKVSGVASYVPGLGDDRIYGSPGADRLMGGAGNDRIYGYGGRDRLYGGPGADVLVGGEDRDRLFGGGGPGRDVLVQ